MNREVYALPSRRRIIHVYEVQIIKARSARDAKVTLSKAENECRFTFESVELLDEG